MGYPYNYCVNYYVKRKAISVCKSTAPLDCILHKVYGSDATTDVTIKFMYISNNTYTFILANQTFDGYYNTTITFTTSSNDTYSFKCILNAGESERGSIYFNTINVRPSLITTHNVIGDNIIYTINPGTYSVIIPGTTNQSQNITFGDVTNSNGVLSQTITINS